MLCIVPATLGDRPHVARINFSWARAKEPRAPETRNWKTRFKFQVIACDGDLSPALWLRRAELLCANIYVIRNPQTKVPHRVQSCLHTFLNALKGRESLNGSVIYVYAVPW